MRLCVRAVVWGIVGWRGCGVAMAFGGGGGEREKRVWSWSWACGHRGNDSAAVLDRAHNCRLLLLSLRIKVLVFIQVWRELGG